MKACAREPPALEVRHLSSGYRHRTVLCDLGLDVPRRGIFALMGPSGVGKSTFLRTLSRWNEALPSFWVEGVVRVEGVDLLSQVDAETARERLPLLNQMARLHTGSVLENLVAAVPAASAGPRSRAAKLEEARQLLDRWGLWEETEPVLDQPVIFLPVGQQRRLALARLASGPAAALLLDEPFRDLPEAECEALVALVSAIARERAVIVSSHNQRLMRGIARTVALLAAGRLVEVAPVERFFESPAEELTREYLRSGNCWPRSEPPGEGDWRMVREDRGPDPLSVPTGHFEQPTPGVSAQPAPSGGQETAAGTGVAPGVTAAEPPGASPARVRPLRPDTFHWVIPGLLGGCQQPGLLRTGDREMAGLVSLGCRVLVNLRSEQPPEEGLGERFGLESVHFPVEDMGVPELAAAAELCQRIERWLASGSTTVLHCKAGIGRTGTLLAAYLVYRGSTAVEAIRRVRTIYPAYIQSDAQLAFVDRFEKHLRTLAPEAEAGSGAAPRATVADEEPV